jgi:hypothetical protein
VTSRIGAREPSQRPDALEPGSSAPTRAEKRRESPARRTPPGARVILDGFPVWGMMRWMTDLGSARIMDAPPRRISAS